MDISFAPGQPGIPSTWTTGAKNGVGTALSVSSRVWFTLSKGILTETYFPWLDHACIRQAGFLVTAWGNFFSDESEDASHQVSYETEGVPDYRLVNVCSRNNYRIEKEIITDPRRNALLQKTRFVPLQGEMGDFRLFFQAEPHLGNLGTDNTAYLDDYRGQAMLFARREIYALALACSAPWKNRSVGFMGVSDGRTDLSAHHDLTAVYDRAEYGNVALLGEIDLAACGGEFVLALGFGANQEEAGEQARAALAEDFETVRQLYIHDWAEWQKTSLPLRDENPSRENLHEISAMVMRVHEAKSIQGGIIASLAIPWGFIRHKHQQEGYHLVWPRDLVEAAFALSAIGAHGDCFKVIRYLDRTQDRDGRWPQNMWLNGTPYWKGVQMDETALPILLVEHAMRTGILGGEKLERFWPMVRMAAGYLVRNGPVTQEDRWEMDPGYSPFTLAAEIAALLAAADIADRVGEMDMARYLRETADNWNVNIERWTYVTDTEPARRAGVKGHYARISSPETSSGTAPRNGHGGEISPDEPVSYLVGPDALALVRFGLRGPRDPRILDTIRVVDRELKVDTPYGPVWRRYPGDRYGEHEDGRPYDGTGVGRAWPLLAAERGEYEIAAGNLDAARELLHAMESFAGEGGLIPEQVWDAPDIPEHGLRFGRPTGSAMPLVWAHAAYLKLVRSLHEEKVWDMPPQTVQRYQVEKIGSPFSCWRFNNKRKRIPAGKTLRLETLASAMVHWSADGWRTLRDTPTRDTNFGVHVADLDTRDLPPGSGVVFTFYWHGAERWEGTDFTVGVEQASESPETYSEESMLVGAASR